MSVALTLIQPQRTGITVRGIWTCADPEGLKGSPDSPKNHKNRVSLSNTGPDPLKNHKATKPVFYSMMGHHGHASETSFKWRYAGKPIMARL